MFVKTILLTVMVWIINISLVAMAVGWVNPPPESYTVYYSEDDGQTMQEIITVKDLEDPEVQQYKDVKNYYIIAKSGKISENVSAALSIVTTIFGLALGVATFYTNFWNMGDIDANNFELRGTKYSKTRPLIIALAGYSPFILSYLLLIVFKIFNVFPLYSKVFYYLNYYAFYFIGLIMPNVNLTNDSLISVIAVGVILLIIPAICYLAYLLGTKHIDVRRKLIYKKEQNNG